MPRIGSGGSELDETVDGYHTVSCGQGHLPSADMKSNGEKITASPIGMAGLAISRWRLALSARMTADKT